MYTVSEEMEDPSLVEGFGWGSVDCKLEARVTLHVQHNRNHVIDIVKWNLGLQTDSGKP